jgi:hypothetical protein
MLQVLFAVGATEPSVDFETTERPRRNGCWHSRTPHRPRCELTTIREANSFIETRIIGDLLSLAPGFSPVVVDGLANQPFQRFSHVRQAVETAFCLATLNTPLKRGANKTLSAGVTLLYEPQ